MRSYRILISKMISLHKLGNGLFSMLACACVDGVMKVYSLGRLTIAIKYYLLGNPINVWSSTVSIAVFGLVAAVYLLRWQRHYVDFTPAYLDHIHFAGIYPLLAWGLHYAPFFIMGRSFLINPTDVQSIIRPSLPSRIILCNPSGRIRDRPFHPQPFPRAKMGCVYCSLHRRHRNIHPLQRHLIWHGRQRK
jgi:C-terminal four TMM region of protein-O-mannosyltransferase